MPTNKNAQLRYQVLDRCFSDFTRSYTFEDLLDEVNETLYDLTGKTTSVRTIRDDIKYMSDRMTYNAPIKRIPITGRKCYYRYADRDFSIFKNELSQDEVNKLSSVIDMLGRYRGNPNYAWVEDAINSLECRFGLKPNTEQLVSFESNDRLKGLEFLSGVIDATIEHQTLEIRYQSFKGTERIYTFHPYFVKQYNNRWFLFGKIDGNNFITNFALDRFISFTESGVPFIENTYTDFTTYFDDIIGVTKMLDYEKEPILLKFDAGRFPYVVNKPIHKSQTIVDEKKHIIQLDLRFNSELESHILFYGPDVEVLSPEWLRNRIREKIEENLRKYSIVQKDSTIKD